MADQPLNIAEAQELIAGHCSLLAAETTAVDDALGLVLAEQVIASGDRDAQLGRPKLAAWRKDRVAGAQVFAGEANVAPGA